MTKAGLVVTLLSHKSELKHKFGMEEIALFNVYSWNEANDDSDTVDVLEANVLKDKMIIKGLTK